MPDITYVPNCGWSTVDNTFTLPKTFPSFFSNISAVRSIILTPNLAPDGFTKLKSIKVLLNITPPSDGVYYLNVFLDLWAVQTTTSAGNLIIDNTQPVYTNNCQSELYNGVYQSNLSLTNITFEVDRTVWATPLSQMISFARKEHQPGTTYDNVYASDQLAWVLTIDNYSRVPASATLNTFTLTASFDPVPAQPSLVPQRAFVFPRTDGSVVQSQFRGYQSFRFLRFGPLALGLLDGCRVARTDFTKIKALRISGTNTGSSSQTAFKLTSRRGSTYTVLYDSLIALPSGQFYTSILDIRRATYDVRAGDVLFVELTQVSVGLSDVLIQFDGEQA